MLFDDTTSPLLDASSGPVMWADSMSVVLQDAVFENTWDVDAGSGCRVVFLFDNGVRVSWVGDGSGGVPDLAQVWVDPTLAGDEYMPRADKSAPTGCPVDVVDLSPEWNPTTQTWDFDVNPADVVAIISDAVPRYGRCSLGLPWESFTTGGGAVEEASYDFPEDMTFAEILANLTDEKIEEIAASFEDECIEVAGPVMLAASRKGIALPSEWGDSVIVGMGGDWIPPGSPHARFMEMMVHLSEQPDWVVDWNECCGTCAGSTITMLAQDKGLTRETAKTVVLYGQNAQYAWPPDGTVNYAVYVNETEAAELVELAKQFGLSCTVGDGRVLFH